MQPILLSKKDDKKQALTLNCSKKCIWVDVVEVVGLVHVKRQGNENNANEFGESHYQSYKCDEFNLCNY